MQYNPKRIVKKAISLPKRAKEYINKRTHVSHEYIFSIDNPKSRVVEDNHIVVEGWILSKKSKQFQLRLKNSDKLYAITQGGLRPDVVKAYPDADAEAALHSGFSTELTIENGTIILEINEGKGFKTLYAMEILYAPEKLPAALYNKDLSNNYPEHLNLIENNRKLYFEDELTGEYPRHKKDPRLMAIYLPQFHPLPENDKAWGKGFTEWTNVSTATSRFVGHTQPILPKDLGFYDLRLESKLKEQIDLAKKYGVFGFCFYYYWFSGHKVMDLPIRNFLKHKEWDFNFTICWANENWTKRWDGRDSEVIVAQKYREEDPLAFIKDVESILLDDRYVQEDGKPVLMVYRASELKEPARYAEVWRDYFKKKHGKQLHLVSFLSFDDKDPREYGFDAALDFSPLGNFFKTHLFENNQLPYVDIKGRLIDVNFSGTVADYREIALNEKLDNVYDFPVYPSIIPSWDNDARKKGKGFIFHKSNPDIYASWLRRIIGNEVQKKESPLIFLNAWNEWAEGAVLEPTMHLGHAVLNRTAETLAHYSVSTAAKSQFPAYGIGRKRSTKLAVIIHLFYPDLWPDIKKKLEQISVPYDVFVSVNEANKHFKLELENKSVTIRRYVVPNRGRDVLPFLHIVRRIKAAGYEYLLKVHTKKSKHRQDGADWFEDVLGKLLPSSSSISAIIKKLEAPKTGIIGSQDHLVSLKRHMGSNAGILESLLVRSYGKDVAAGVISAPERFPYIGGTMFWARIDVFDRILDLHLIAEDFQSEHGQVDGTTAHALERMFGIASKLERRKMYLSSAEKLKETDAEEFDEKYRFAP